MSGIPLSNVSLLCLLISDAAVVARHGLITELMQGLLLSHDDDDDNDDDVCMFCRGAGVVVVFAVSSSTEWPVLTAPLFNPGQQWQSAFSR